MGGTQSAVYATEVSAEEYLAYTTEETADESGETTPVEKTIPAGNVNGKGNTGSIVGWLKSGKVESCMSTATVKGSGNTGGLVGLVGAETVGETAFVCI